ncbi:larval cuticle protein LCP-17-like [Pollicipes pollicipes]|uniref:larval cuticle protein LCP-17-like n=1 Tax=Pollicipes pollicipes TaxID=41117 RepID=UPI0018853F7B|nr:larval cuticle protein LCP-17-like [Pollicipes pollicipes]
MHRLVLQVLGVLCCRLVAEAGVKQRRSPFGSAGTQLTPVGYDGEDRDATIISYENVQTDDGYQFGFETSNGIAHEEVGLMFGGRENNTGVMVTEGRVQWDAPGGFRFEVLWHADENGYQPTGVHLVSEHWHPLAQAPSSLDEYKLLRSARERFNAQETLRKVEALAQASGSGRPAAKRD